MSLHFFVKKYWIRKKNDSMDKQEQVQYTIVTKVKSKIVCGDDFIRQIKRFSSFLSAT